MQSNLKPKERRLIKRRRLTGLLPGPVVIGNSEERLHCKPIDISETGIGLLISKELKVDSILYMVVDKIKIPLKVKWIQADFAKSDRFRYGLECQSDINIEELFIAKKCYK